MDDDIIEFYASQVQARSGDARYERVAHVLYQASSEVGIPLRPDATYFLANGINDLVIAPATTVVRFGQPIVDAETLEDMLQSDLRLLVKRAANVSTGRERHEISSTSAMIALGQVVEKLRINDLKIWGRR